MIPRKLIFISRCLRTKQSTKWPGKHQWPQHSTAEGRELLQTWGHPGLRLQTDPGLQSKALSNTKKEQETPTVQTFQGIHVINLFTLSRQGNWDKIYPRKYDDSACQRHFYTILYQWELLTKWAHRIRKEHQPGLASPYAAGSQSDWWYDRQRGKALSTKYTCGKSCFSFSSAALSGMTCSQPCHKHG